MAEVWLLHVLADLDSAEQVRRALAAYHGDEGAFLGLQRRAMRADFSWTASARTYLNIYRQAIADAQAR